MFLEIVSGNFLTAKHWVENSIKPFFIWLVFVRAEREGEWLYTLLQGKHASLLLWWRASQLCSVWLILPEQHRKATTGSNSEVYEKGACNETSTRLLEWYLFGHVHRNKFYLLWKGSRWGLLGKLKARSC